MRLDGKKRASGRSTFSRSIRSSLADGDTTVLSKSGEKLREEYDGKDPSR